MAKKEWGTKRQCLSCGARFYDLGKSEIVCPKCETVFVPESLLKSKRWQVADKPPPSEEEKPAEEKTKAESGEGLVEDTIDANASANANADDDADANMNDTLLADDDDDDSVSSVIASKPSVEGSS